MTLVSLTYWDLGVCALLILLTAGLTRWHRVDLHKDILISAARSFVQLMLVGAVLGFLFAQRNLFLLTLWAMVMLLVAGREVNARQKYRLKGRYGFGLSVASMFSSSFVLTVFALLFVIGYQPWYQPQYAIPLLGMMLGNTMNGVALSLDRLSQSAVAQRDVIEQRLMLGERWYEAISDIKREAVRSGMIPMINGMATAGLVSLPGMMTGQILSGTDPAEAVKYQILIFFLITSGTGLGVLCATWFGAKKMFDERERFLPDRLLQTGNPY